MPDEDIRELLVEIRDLLRPIADAYQDEFDRREAEREASRIATIRSLVTSSEKRAKAWKLADGGRTQRVIAREAGMDEGGASKFFKSLRELKAVSDSPNPTRLLEV